MTSLNKQAEKMSRRPADNDDYFGLPHPWGKVRRLDCKRLQILPLFSMLSSSHVITCALRSFVCRAGSNIRILLVHE